MAQEPGSVLTGYNTSLVTCLEGLKNRRDELNQKIDEEEQTRIAVSEELRELTKELQAVNEELARKQQSREEYMNTIRETEGAYMKILESSQTLLTVLKKEGINIENKSKE